MSEDKNDLIEQGKLSEEMLQEIAEDMKIKSYATTHELKDMCRNAANVTQKYTEIYYGYRRNMKKIDVRLKQHEAELFKAIKNDGLDGLHISSSADIFRIIKRDGKYIKLRRMMDEFETAVAFLEDVLKNFNTRSWKLRDLVELEKIDNL